ncbi:HGGxSTG domain-containing protein [Bacillus thuringiensis]|uniref:HGGxSTG domain-containing protein n=1 Tax=Bacillus thuringiensis TaxID=1428 RepID=UPI0011A140BD|nr:HGGxSTG domain-containing protein [Bacillus thuringiensis]
MKQHEKMLIQRLKNDALTVANEINDMSYDTARKKKAEFLRKQLKDVKIICGAINANGKICTKEPVESAARCANHGGLSTGPITEEGKERALANLSPQANMIYGLYARFVMTDEERVFYGSMVQQYEENYELDLANLMLLDRALRNFILNQRKEIAEAGEQVDESNSYNDYDTKFLRYMQALGFDRKFNVSKEHKDNDKGVNLNMLFDMGDSV